MSNSSLNTVEVLRCISAAASVAAGWINSGFMSAPFGDGCVRTPSYAGSGRAPYESHEGICNVL